jgi:hypothetical protein
VVAAQPHAELHAHGHFPLRRHPSPDRGERAS